MNKPLDLPTHEPELPALLRVEELAGLLRINRKTAYAAVHAGHIPGARRIGRSIRVSRDAVLEWLRRAPAGRLVQESVKVAGGQSGVSRSRR